MESRKSTRQTFPAEIICANGMQNWKLRFPHEPPSHTLPTNTVYPFNNATQLTEIRERAREQILERERKKLVVLKCNKLESRLNKRKVNKSIRKWEKLLITHKDVRTRSKRNKKTCLKQMKRSRTKQESVLTEYLRKIVVGGKCFSGLIPDSNQARSSSFAS